MVGLSSQYLSSCKCHLRLASSDKSENNFRYLKRQNKENIYICFFDLDIGSKVKKQNKNWCGGLHGNKYQRKTLDKKVQNSESYFIVDRPHASINMD